MENFDINELLPILGSLAVGVVGLGAFISRFTKTPKDDAFFERLKGVFKLGGK